MRRDESLDAPGSMAVTEISPTTGSSDVTHRWRGHPGARNFEPSMSLVDGTTPAKLR
jgi:hypothetical protein